MSHRFTPLRGRLAGRIDQIASTAFWGSIVLATLPLVLLSAFIVPMGDDWCFAAHRRHMGAAGVNAFYYNTWTGRFASTAVLTSFPISPLWYRAYPLITLAALAASIFWFIHTCIGRYVTRRDCMFVAAVVTIVYVNMMPHLAAGLYWFPGVVTYQWASILTLVTVSLCLTALTSTHTAVRVSCLAAAGFVSFAAVAMNESTLAMLPVVLLFCMIFSGRGPLSSRIALAWVIPLVGAVAGAVIVIRSPGNALRAANFPGAGNASWTVTLSAIDTVLYGTRWLATGPLLVGSILCIPVGIRAVLAMRTAGLRVPRPLHTAVATILVIGAGFLPPSWGLGTVPPGRTLNAMCFIFVIGWMIVLTGLLDAGIDRDISPTLASPPPRVRLLITVVFGLTLLSNGVLTAYGDVGRTAHAYQRENALRDREVAAAQAGAVRDPVLTGFTTYPFAVTTAYWDLQQDSTQWMNRCFAEYAGFSTVRVR